MPQAVSRYGANQLLLDRAHAVGRAQRVGAREQHIHGHGGVHQLLDEVEHDLLPRTHGHHRAAAFGGAVPFAEQLEQRPEALHRVELRYVVHALRGRLQHGDHIGHAQGGGDRQVARRIGRLIGLRRVFHPHRDAGSGEAIRPVAGHKDDVALFELLTEPRPDVDAAIEQPHQGAQHHVVPVRYALRTNDEDVAHGKLRPMRQVTF